MYVTYILCIHKNNSIKMKEDVGTSKLKMHANKANIGPNIKQTTSISIYTAIKQNTQSYTYVNFRDCNYRPHKNLVVTPVNNLVLT